MSCVCYIPRRFIVTAYTFVGFMVMLYLRANLSIAIVDMTSNRTVVSGNSTQTIEAEFTWTSLQLGIILSAFNYGYVFSPPGGMLAARYGGATVFGLGVLITGCLTVLTPIFCRVNLIVFILTRVLEGIFEAFSTASTVVIFAHWSPPDERARLISISIAGAYLGTSMNYPISGFIAKEYGWEAVFYISGAISIAWYLLWISFVTNDPAEHKSISEEERVYLKRTIQFINKKKISYPWKKIITSEGVWAFFIHRFANSWASVFILLCLPMYFKGLFKVNIADIGILSSIPNFCTMATQPIAAVMFDYIRNRKYLSSTGVRFWGRISSGDLDELLSLPSPCGAMGYCIRLTFVIVSLWLARFCFHLQVHKAFTCGSYVLSGIILLLVPRCTNYMQALICFTLLRFSSTHGETSYYTLPVDLSPPYSGLLNGMGTAFYSLGSLLSPMLLGYIVSDLNDQSLWKNYFQILSGILLVAALIFFILGSGDLQPWEGHSDSTKEVVVDESEKENDRQN